MNEVEIVFNTLLRRRSTRSFAEGAVEQEQIRLLLQAGIHAPSGANTQNQRFLVVQDPERLKHWGAIRRPLIGEAKAAIAVFTKGGELGCPVAEAQVWAFLDPQNVAASIENMAVMATAMKLGSCWMSLSRSMDGTRVLHGKTCADLFPDVDLTHYDPWGILLLGVPEERDDMGYPKGNRRHAARSVERWPLGEYLL